jgi:hypothetical protein
MRSSKYLGRMCLTAVALAWGTSASFAADVTAPPAPVVIGASPVGVAGPGCAGCETCPEGGAKSKFRPGLLHKDKNAPFNVTLCPGACYGYFQTQWRKWDDVCPYPYTGIGVSDAPRLPGAPLPPLPGGLGQPRPLDPKVTDPKMADPKKVEPKKNGPKKGSVLPPGNGGAYSSYHLPAIPVAPSKFAP